MLKQMRNCSRCVRVGFPRTSFQEKILPQITAKNIPIVERPQAEVFPPELQPKPHDPKVKAPDRVKMPVEVPDEPIIEIGPFTVDQVAYQNWFQDKFANLQLIKDRMKPFYGSRPAYRKYFVFSTALLNALHKLPRATQEMLARQVMEILIDCDRLFYQANINEDKAEICQQTLAKIASNLEVLSFLLRLSVERSNIGVETLHDLLEKYVDCCDQVKKWRTSLSTAKKSHAWA